MMKNYRLIDTPLYLTILAIISILFISVTMRNTQAQDFADFEDSAEDDLLVSDDDIASGSSLTDYFIGEVGLLRASSNTFVRSATIYNIGLDVPFSFGRFYTTYGGIESEINITQELRVPDAPRSAGLPPTRIITTTVDDTNFRESFIQLNLGPAVTLSAGRQKNAWGQFELFSPAVIMQPLNANVTTLLPSKLDLLQAQDQVQVSIFPTSRIELSLHAISSLRTDRTVETNLQNWVSPRGEFTGERTIVPKLESMPLELKKPADPKQSAARLAFYPNWGNIAFTHHKGYNAVIPLLNTDIGANSYIIDEFVGTRQYFGIVSGYKNTDDSYLYYPEGTLNAFEMSIPTGKWTWRYEMAVVESVSALNRQSGNIEIYGGMEGLTTSSAEEFLNATYSDARDEELRGTALYKSTVTTTAIGFQYQGTEWTVDATIVTLGVPEPNGADEQRLVTAYNALKAQEAESDDEEEEPTYQLPLFTAFRKGGDEDQHGYAVTAGTIGLGFGYGVVYTYSFTEDLSLGFSTGYIDYDSAGSDTATYKTIAPGASVQTSLAWRF